MTKRVCPLFVTVVLLGAPAFSFAQGTVQDYLRANALRDKYRNLMPNVAEAPSGIDQTNLVNYRRTVKAGTEWILVDGATKEKQPAFDHAKLAAGIASATNRKATATDLPFNNFTFVDNGRSIEFALGE